MKLFLHASVLMLLLFALVAGVGSAFLTPHGEPPWMALVFAVAMFAVEYWYAPRIIEWLFDIQWDDQGTELPARNREFLGKLCADRGLKMPRVGFISSDTPNAFTYGRAPGNARVVVTTGLLRILDTEETNAVLAHEMGHVEHWDFVVMTVAALAPVLLYQLYRAALRAGDSPENGDNKNKAPFLVEGSYLCYLLSRFLVLMLSRTREYSADRYAARVTGTPNALASALIKIAYGMVRVDGEFQHAMQDAAGDQRSRLSWERSNTGALALMGISNLHAGGALALGRSDGRGASGLMRWDLVNPWARLYELNSTHPLTALRIRSLNEEAEVMHQKPEYPLPEDRRMSWDTFPLEALIWAAPWLAAAALVVVLKIGRPPSSLGPSLLMLTGMAWVCRIWFRYYGTMQPATIEQLLQDVEVSEMRPRAVRLEGKILGFGVPGAFWCPDLVLQEDGSLLYVWYRQSIPFARLIFALSSADRYIGQRVVIEGWFRRGLRPYLEISCLMGEDGKPRRAYSRWVQYGAAAVVAMGGFVWMAVAR
jgi:heat shock protein HtpX